MSAAGAYGPAPLVPCRRYWHSQGMTQLVSATDRHFAWLLGEAQPPDGLREAPGGVEQRDALKWLRSIAALLESAGCPGSWLIVDAGEVVGLCGFKGASNPSGSVEIGYGVAQSRRRAGHATKAVSLLCAEVSRSAALVEMRAETAVDNLFSQQVLERNGFARVGKRRDAEDGDLLLWSKALVAIVKEDRPEIAGIDDGESSHARLPLDRPSERRV